jgi:hypothetical protein
MTMRRAYVLLLLAGGCSVPGWEPVPGTPTAAGWLLVAPPNLHLSGAVRMDDRAPLWMWTRLAAFEDVVACERHRNDRIADASDDEEWAMWSMARCVTAERAEGGRMPPGE